MMAVALFAVASSALAQPADPASPSPEVIRETVRALGRTADKPYVLLQRLEKSPRLAAAVLIDELAVIRDPPTGAFVPRESALNTSRGREINHVIWCVRGLGYLTDGLSFVAPTDHVFTKKEARRRAHLLGEVEDEDALPARAAGKQLPFFATWMSRSATFVAPEDAQREIIKQWRAWFEAHGDTYDYRPAQSFDDWYFGGDTRQ